MVRPVLPPAPAGHWPSVDAGRFRRGLLRGVAIVSRGTPALRKMGWQRTNWVAIRRVIRLRERGWTYVRIGAEMGFSWQRAHQIYHRYKGPT